MLFMKCDLRQLNAFTLIFRRLLILYATLVAVKLSKRLEKYAVI